MPRVEWNHERAERPFVWAYRMKYYCVSVWACVVRSGIVTRGSMYDMWGREREASNRCHNNFQRMSWLRILLKTFNNGLECGTSSFFLFIFRFSVFDCVFHTLVCTLFLIADRAASKIKKNNKRWVLLCRQCMTNTLQLGERARNLGQKLVLTETNEA